MNLHGLPHWILRLLNSFGSGLPLRGQCAASSFHDGGCDKLTCVLNCNYVEFASPILSPICPQPLPEYAKAPDTSIWLLGFDKNGHHTVRRLDDGVITGKPARRLDPESLVGDRELFVYYTLVGDGSSQLTAAVGASTGGSGSKQKQRRLRHHVRKRGTCAGRATSQFKQVVDRLVVFQHVHRQAEVTQRRSADSASSALARSLVSPRNCSSLRSNVSRGPSVSGVLAKSTSLACRCRTSRSNDWASNG